jgi:diguanylate cyclase (GGDEF)-like protein
VSLSFALLSAALLCVVASAFFLPWDRLPRWMTVLLPIAEVGFVLTLTLATGSASSGVGIIILVPLIWTALYHRRWESFVVVGAIVACEAITALTPVAFADAVILRRVVFWGALGLLISVATHGLRDTLRGSMERRDASLRRTVAFAAAAQDLTMLLNPDEVLVTATRLAAEIVTQPEGYARRAQYNRNEGGMVRVIAQYDEAGQAISAPFPLSEQPNLVEVLRTGVTTQLPLIPDASGPTVRRMIESLGATSSVYIPVHHDGWIDGILSVPLRGGAVTADLVEFCRAFGHLVELALRNAYVHRALENEATSDTLTGLPNRRAFDELMRTRPARVRFAIIAIDLDGLKQINDTLGHDAGDRMLMQAALDMQGALRQGDVVARIGGDEFAAFLFNASQEDAELVATRMLANLDGLPTGTAVPRLSIGIASGGPQSEALDVLVAADGAMYQAKREGGGKFVVSEYGNESEIIDY